MRTIPSAVWATIESRPEAEAVVEGSPSGSGDPSGGPGRRVTYRELGQLVLDATRAMMGAGIGPGDRVAVLAGNSLHWVVAALGVHSAGAALVPVNTRWKGPEVAQLLATSRASLLVTSIGFLGTDAVAMLDAAAGPDGSDGPDGHNLRDLGGIVLLPDSGPPPDGRPADACPVRDWSDFLAGGAAVSEEEAVSRLRSVSPDDPSDVLFTSGTTGRPKGVVMNHGQTVRQFGAWCDDVGLEPGDRYLIVNPFFHMFGYKAGWLASLLRGATIVPVAVFDVAAVLAAIERERITVLPGAPTIYRSILDHPDLSSYDISSLRIAVTGAADIPVSLIEEMRERLPFPVLLTGYGLTEAGTCTLSRPGDDARRIATTAGRAVDEVEVRIAGPDGAELARGETGEVLVRGYNVMQGYFENPEATAEAIDERGFLHTGDLATMDAAGYVTIVGRLKDMIIVGGFNVYPAEVEGAMLGHPDVGQVAVVGIPDQRLGEVPMAWVVPAPGRSPDPDGLIAWSRERMANYKTPRRVELLDALPINAAGKVVKEELRARAEGSVR